MRFWFGYFSPDDWYEALVDRLVVEGCSWVDVGGGKGVFPYNQVLSEILAKRCGLLVGVDPSDNLDQNRLVHERVKCMIEEYSSERTFDLATLRMVVEHIPDPNTAVESLARLIKPGGRVVIYTPNRWSPTSIASSVIPFRFHHSLKQLFWQTEKEDTFPTFYRMNTRKRLRDLFGKDGFKEVTFAYPDACILGFNRFRTLYFLQLLSWWMLRTVGLRHPENCLLGVYEKT